MKMDRHSEGYRLKLLKFDQVWLPFSFWTLFVVVGIITRTQDRYFDLTRIYLCVVTPLMAGILSAYSLLDDPVLELKFAAPVSTNRLLLERLGSIFLVQTVFVFLFQGYAALVHADLSALGNFWQLQLVWLVPCLSALTLGSFVALLGASTVAGAITIGFFWLLQAIFHSFFASNQVLKYLYWFMGGLNPGHPDLGLNQWALLGLTLLFLLAGLRLLRRQERYL